ncbi:MAG: response regulator transcription factor [Firmicutes bacterium]|nr:response regulator transcription factor [Bacillota bacterium]MBR7114105.1 response regulator transcription factor [Bacillota bacterium]
MLKIAICDDEQQYLDNTCAMLQSYAQAHRLDAAADAFTGSSALLDRIEAGERHDVYLLDIYMPGVSGMSVATELRSRGVHSPIIFLTSSTEHALEAFGVDATHYLLKPYTQQSFFAAMDKAVQSITAHTEESLVLKIGGGYQNVSVADIIYCEAADNHQCLHLQDGTELLVRITAGELYDQLAAFGCFYRCGRAYILNLNHIKKVGTATALLKNGAEIQLPRSAVSGLRNAFFDHFN